MARFGCINIRDDGSVSWRRIPEAEVRFGIECIHVRTFVCGVETRCSALPLQEEQVPVHPLESFKTVLLGDSNVGKTCIARLLVERRVVEENSVTIGFDHYGYQLQTQETPVVVCAWFLHYPRL